jgi:HK97 family phage major capsid protein
MADIATDLEDQIARNKRSAEQIWATAREEHRDLVDTEEATLDRLAETNNGLNARLERATRDMDVSASVRERLQLVRSATPVTYRSAGELLRDMLHAPDDVDARSRVERMQRSVDATREPLRLTRAAEHLGLDKANTVAVAGGFNGLVVVPSVGAVLDPSPVGAPLFSTLGPVPATTATFQRPRIVDPNFDTGVAGNLQEKEEGPSKAWDIVAEPLTLDVVRGYINVSELLLEMVAGSLDMVISHMNRRLEWALERAAFAAVGSGAEVIPLAADADAAAAQAAIAAAKASVFRATKAWPTWIAFGADGAERLMALTDAAGRPLFPNIGAANALGTSDGGPPATVAGLRSVPTHAITDADLYIGNSASVEAYLRRFPIMQALEPALWGRQIGVAAAATFYNPITTEAGAGNVPPAERAGVAKIDWA